MLIVNKIFRVTVLLLVYLRMCAHTEENVETVNDVPEPRGQAADPHDCP